MKLAMRRMKGVALVMGVLLVVMALYPVSLRVAATRGELARVERDLARTARSIRDLESEVAVRASMSQLEAWNSENFGYVPPTAAQYLDGERALASLDRLPSALTAPSPVLMAMARDRTGDGKADARPELPGAATPLPGARMAQLEAQLVTPAGATAGRDDAAPDAARSGDDAPDGGRR